MLTSTSLPCSFCIADKSLRLVNFSRSTSASSADIFSGALQMELPYSQASLVQRRQVMLSSRKILQAAFPFVEEQQWVEALDDLQLPLHLTTEEVTLYRDGLTTLIRYLVACYPTVPLAYPPDSNMLAHADIDPLAPKHQIKQTYAIYVSLAEQLNRVSYWRRKPRTWFVNRALTQLLSRYPETLIPLPKE
jgi:hypothetical protein